MAVGRELTKAHEEWVRGPISVVRSQLENPRGEFTVVVDIGQSIEEVPMTAAPTAAQMLTELGEMTENKPLTRRAAVNALARRHRLPPNEVYQAIERVKKSGK